MHLNYATVMSEDEVDISQHWSVGFSWSQFLDLHGDQRHEDNDDV